MAYVFVTTNDHTGALRAAIWVQPDDEGNIDPAPGYEGPFEVPENFGDQEHEMAFYRIKDGQLIIDPEAVALFRREQQNAFEAEMREKRTRLLAACDYTQMPDYVMKEDNREKWSEYRQALRDITKQPGFPDAIVWPEAPR